MKFYRKNWYYIGGVIFVILTFLTGFFGCGVNPVRKILILSFMALLVHQFEEYALPGGFPLIFNKILSKEKEHPDRFPLNSMSSCIVNTFMGYTFYLLPVIFPDWYWLGILTMMFGFSQFIVHGILVNVKIKSLYNPGLGAVIFLHYPIGIYYLRYIYSHCTVETWQWFVGIFCTPIAALIIVQLLLQLLKNKNSPYNFSKEEMKDW